MSAADVNNLRKAALALHALPPAEMQRVWARLDTAQHETLSPLLAELSNLGIPKGRAWLDPEEEDATAQSEIVDEARRCRAVVWGVRAEQVLPVLTAQSIDTAVMVMRIAKWPWLDEVVDGWPADRRHGLKARLAQGRGDVPVNLADRLLQSMAAALLARHGAGATGVRPVGKPWYHGLKSLFMLS